jgi:hypothetical protein
MEASIIALNVLMGIFCQVQVAKFVLQDACFAQKQPLIALPANRDLLLTETLVNLPIVIFRAGNVIVLLILNALSVQLNIIKHSIKNVIPVTRSAVNVMGI